MATVFFLHLTCFDTRQRSTAAAATTKKKKKPKVLAENVHQSAGVRCGAARPGEPCESGNCSCPKTGSGRGGGRVGQKGWVFFFLETHHNSPRCPAQRAVGQRGTCTFQATPTLALFMFHVGSPSLSSSSSTRLVGCGQCVLLL